MPSGLSAFFGCGSLGSCRTGAESGVGHSTTRSSLAWSAGGMLSSAVNVLRRSSSSCLGNLTIQACPRTGAATVVSAMQVRDREKGQQEEALYPARTDWDYKNRRHRGQTNVDSEGKLGLQEP
ncbi:hypothetical protein NDU88_007556 [Pleurodeles waltl]|uniref:Uncharacterized protein n=1 Tax=Pleurodeles waltl TaxID=8319 RepID=A0AAV7WGL2_PLEWA|nr:hypothetical protein NDU88_007556 [Pleurodeles waltl]